jgi:rare lipoprotein A (peptidoglycan hydrolase)
MKKALFLCFSFVLPVLLLCAAQRNVFDGLGTWYSARNSALMASHAYLPFGTRVRVINLENGKEVIVKIGGRIPAETGLMLNVSSSAAKLLQMNIVGMTQLRIEIENRGPKQLVNRTVERELIQEGRAVRLDEENRLIIGHPSLAEGSRVLITNLENGREVSATVTYRIRASRVRLIEVSNTLGQRLGIDGYAEVRIKSIPE